MDNWKKYLLKSGLPFEYEVKECFAERKCTVWDEYSYIKYDENNIEKEFSYDVDACYMTLNGFWINFLIECKYKTEPTSWFFLPDPYSYQREVNQNSFLHCIDYFTTNKFIFDKSPYYNVKNPLGPFCLKGVEIFQNQFIETNIFKAINQLSYAFVEKVIDAFMNQLSDFESFSNTIYFNIPIIITNAELRLINKNLTTCDIENCQNIDEISQRHDFLFFNNKTGQILEQYNKEALNAFFSGIDKEVLKNNNSSFTSDISHFINVISEYYCPSVILIMHHDKEHENYNKLFDYINFLMQPSEELKNRMKEVVNERNDRLNEINQKYKKK
jgi:hypothetical protein